MKSSHFILVVILVLGLFVRIWQIDKVPPSLYWDEMDAGYQAFSILKTGKDYFGNFPFPLAQSFADYRAPGFIYSLIPFVAILGFNEFAVRIPAAIFGILCILLIYLVSKKLFNSELIGLVAALLMAFSPWNIQYSRMGFEITLMLASFLAGIWFYLWAERNSKFYIYAGLCFAISILTYNTAKLFLPIILILLFLFFKRSKEKNFYTGLGIFVSIFLITLYGTFFLGGGKRFSQIAVWTDPQMANQINVIRNDSALAYSGVSVAGMNARFLDKIIYNKLTYSLESITENYLTAFSPQFLFISGDPNVRHSPARMGELYRIEFITLILGLGYLVFNYKREKRASIFIIRWLIFAPLPAILTQEGGTHASRLAFMQPVLTIISALGVVFILQILPRKGALVALAGIFLAWIFGVLYFLNYYFGSYKIESAKAFQYGFREAANEAAEFKDRYDYVIIDDRNDSALMNYLLASNYNPADFQPQANSLGYEISGIKSARLGNVLFFDPKRRDWASIFSKNLINEDFLLIVSAEQFEEQTISKVPEKLTKYQKMLDVIFQQNGDVAFYVIENRKVPD